MKNLVLDKNNSANLYFLQAIMRAENQQRSPRLKALSSKDGQKNSHLIQKEQL